MPQIFIQTRITLTTTEQYLEHHKNAKSSLPTYQNINFLNLKEKYPTVIHKKLQKKSKKW